MFNHQDGVASIDQALEDAEEPLDVVHMQPRRRFIQDIEALPVGLTVQFRRQLHPLGFPTRQGRRRLSQVNIAEAHVFDCLEFPPDLWNGTEEFQSLRDGHVQDFRDVLALVFHFEGLRIVAGPVANLTRDIHVGQEVHLNFKNPVPMTGLTAAALNVEAEAALGIAPHLSLVSLGEELPNIVKDPGVGGRVTARCPANR